MHCRCNLVFCYKCGGVLKGTAKSNGLSACTCGAQREAELRAHEGAPNHNLMGGGHGGGHGGGPMGIPGLAGMAVAAQRRLAALQAMHGFPGFAAFR